ncbi:hypothetical protein C5167_007392 [Papaver somniferum]|uniref:UPF0481 protein At3g47200-like n=1 Tax=Papaver somniferum TaxID=3469 RepID=UPI000E6F844F|nr:UPF0481 protein At3g47200-like [Papaver somniferum]RZC86206.1 hypothetical protein C5167_007392 [Papaver somniferum]
MQSEMISDGGASISIEMEKLISSSIKKKLENSAPNSRISGGCSIHRVPERYHKLTEPSAYKPEAISIGPYHRTNQSLKATEDLKLLYAHKLLTIRAEGKISKLYAQIVKASEDSSSSPSEEEEQEKEEEQEEQEKEKEQKQEEEEEEQEEEKEEQEEETRTIKLDSSGSLFATEAWFTIVEECVSSIKEMETKIRECYSEPVNINSTEFVEMMVIDGLFIIGMLVRSMSGSFVVDDPLDGNDWLLVKMEEDLLLLENQIPLFVLQCLSNIIFKAGESSPVPLEKLILNVFMDNFPHMLPKEGMKLLEARLNQGEQAKHILDFLNMLIRPPAHTDSSSGTEVKILTDLKENKVVKLTSSLYFFIQFQFTKLKHVFVADKERENLFDTWDFIPSATELGRAGVRFKKGSAEGNFLDIKFNSTGILEIPPLYVYDGTDQLFRNIIACEQIYGGRYSMSSYVSFMDFLINSADDVKLLRKQGIVTNYLGCDQDVSDMFNKFCVGISDGGDYYSTHIKDINKFYTKRRHIWKATLKREYFSNPWAIISVVAAILLITLTIISTVFGILSFFIPKS